MNACTFVGEYTLVYILLCASECVYELCDCICACFSLLVRIYVGMCVFMCEGVRVCMCTRTRISGPRSGQSLDLGMDANWKGLTLRDAEARDVGTWKEAGDCLLPPPCGRRATINVPDC